MQVELRLPDGSTSILNALYDNGAQINLINLSLVKAMNLPDEPKGDKPEASFLDENRLDIHSRHELVLRTCDSNGDSRTVDQQEFWAANFAGYDMVLGWPWLAAADPMISFRTGTFVWGNAEVTRLEAVTVDQLFDGLQKGEKVYSIVAYKK